MEYTKVFQTLKLELAIIAVVALLLGMWIGKNHE
jgi:hypothetical protein